MAGYAIRQFTCVPDDFDLFSNKWDTSNILIAPSEWCSIVYSHTCDLWDDEHPNGYRFKVLTFPPHEKLPEDHAHDRSSAEFRYKSRVLAARSFMWEGKVMPVPSPKRRANFDCLAWIFRSWGWAGQGILPQIPVARSDSALNLWISGERRRNHSEKMDGILNFDLLFWLTLRGRDTALFPWAVWNFLRVRISIQLEYRDQSEFRYKCRISIYPTYFDICCIISIKVIISI
jgi:hypothetical protein